MTTIIVVLPEGEAGLPGTAGAQIELGRVLVSYSLNRVRPTGLDHLRKRGYSTWS